MTCCSAFGGVVTFRQPSCRERMRRVEALGEGRPQRMDEPRDPGTTSGPCPKSPAVGPAAPSVSGSGRVQTAHHAGPLRRTPTASRTSAPGAERDDVNPELWQQYVAEIAALSDRLHEIPIHDTATWAQVARETSGVFAAWSLRTEETPGSPRRRLGRLGPVRADPRGAHAPEAGHPRVLRGRVAHADRHCRRGSVQDVAGHHAQAGAQHDVRAVGDAEGRRTGAGGGAHRTHCARPARAGRGPSQRRTTRGSRRRRRRARRAAICTGARVAASQPSGRSAAYDVRGTSA